MKKKNKIIIFLVIIALVGLFLRTYHIGEEDLWKDETYNLYIAESGNAIEVIKTAIILSPTHPPLGYVILHCWIKLSGTSEEGIRLLSALFGTLSIIIVFLIGAELINKTTGLIAALMIAFSRIQIIFSQDAKHYMMFAAFVLLSSLFWIRFLKRNKTKDLAFYVVFTVFSMYIHIFTVILIVLQTFFLISFSKKIKKWFIGLGIICLSMVPWIQPFYMSIKFEMVALPILMQNKGFPAVISNKLFIFLVIPVLFMAIVLLAILMIKKNTKKLAKIKRLLKKKQGILIAIIIIISLFYILISLKTIEPRSIIKYCFFLIPAFYIINAYFIGLLKNNLIAKILVIIIIMANFSVIVHFYGIQSKERMSEIAELIEKNQQPEDLIIYSGDLAGLAFMYYYKGSSKVIDGYTGKEFADEFFFKSMNQILEGSEERIKQELKSRNGVWVLYSSDYNQKIEKMMENNLKNIIEKVFERKYLNTKLSYYKIKK